MSNPITRRPMTNWLPMTTNPDLMQLLHKAGLVTLAGELEDFLARATKGRWSPRQILEELARREHEERAQRSLKRRLRLAKIGRFKPMDDFDWNWPTRIDREVIERAFTLDFMAGSASIQDRRLTVTLVNPSLDAPIETAILLTQASTREAKATVLTHTDMRAANTFDAPDQVVPEPLAVSLSGDRINFSMPKQSVVALQVLLG